MILCNGNDFRPDLPHPTMSDETKKSKHFRLYLHCSVEEDVQMKDSPLQINDWWCHLQTLLKITFKHLRWHDKYVVNYQTRTSRPHIVKCLLRQSDFIEMRFSRNKNFHLSSRSSRTDRVCLLMWLQFVIFQYRQQKNWFDQKANRIA